MGHYSRFIDGSRGLPTTDTAELFSGDRIVGSPFGGAATDPSQIELLRRADRFIHLDFAIADGALQLRGPEQELSRP